MEPTPAHATVTIARVAKSVFLSWDFLAALGVVVAVFVLLRVPLSVAIARELFGFGLTLGALIFSVYFAALAVIAAAGDDDFVHFFAEGGEYFWLIEVFRITLLVLFVTLLASLSMFFYVAYLAAIDPKTILSHWLVSLFSFTIVYPLFASVNAAWDATKYAERRARYLQLTKDKRRTD